MVTTTLNKEEFKAQFEFADPNLKTAAWLALEAAHGPYNEWHRTACMDARRFLACVKDFTPATLSLASLKSSLMSCNSESRLHHTAFFFLSRVKDYYCADDAAEFHELIGPLGQSGYAYSILFNEDVHSFRDIAAVRYYNRRNFYLIRTHSEAMKPIFRRALFNTRWTCADKPGQKRFDFIFALIDEAAGRPLSDPSDLCASLFFDAIDLLNRKFADGMITAENRRSAIGDIFQIYRHCIRHEGNVRADFLGDEFSPNILLTRESVKFFVSEYVTRERTFVFRRRGSRTYGKLVTINIDNPTVRSAYGYLLRSGRVAQEEYCACKDTLAESLGQHVNTIGTSEPWNESILLEQVNFYRQNYADRKQRTAAIAFVKHLYITIDEQSDGAFFRNAHTMTYGLLVTRPFVRYCDEGFEFRVWSQFDDVTEGEKIVFIVRGFNKVRKKYLNEDHIAVDLSPIQDPFYRSLAWKAITSKPKRLYRVSFAYTLRHLLPLLAKLKRHPAWLTPDLRTFSLYDALAIRALVEMLSASCASCDFVYNTEMMNFRDFLRWASMSGVLTVEEAAIKSLPNKKHTLTPTNTPVLSDDDLATLNGWFLEKSKKDPKYAQALILLNIICITPLRIGHICTLLHQEIVFDDKLGSYVVLSTNKTSGGNIEEYVLGEKANDFIKKAIEISEQTAHGCTSENLREQLFLYCENRKYFVWKPRKFVQYLHKACAACNLPAYNSKNLRATYMTRALIEACEKGEANKFLLKLYSYHKSNGTTLEHYVNHDEALAALTDSLKRGNDWQKTIFPDERKALLATLKDLKLVLDNITDSEQLAIVSNQIQEIQNKLDSLN